MARVPIAESNVWSESYRPFRRLHGGIKAREIIRKQLWLNFSDTTRGKTAMIALRINLICKYQVIFSSENLKLILNRRVRYIIQTLAFVFWLLFQSLPFANKTARIASRSDLGVTKHVHDFQICCIEFNLKQNVRDSRSTGNTAPHNRSSLKFWFTPSTNEWMKPRKKAHRALSENRHKVHVERTSLPQVLILANMRTKPTLKGKS